MKVRVIISILIFGCYIIPLGGKAMKTGVDGGNKTEVPSWYKTDLIIDGSCADWSSRMFYCRFDAKVFYAAANDNSHLFICLQVLDPSEQSAILHDGLVIRLNPEGKKKEACSVQLTCGSPMSMGHGPGAPGSDRPVLRSHAMNSAVGIKLEGFREGDHTGVPQDPMDRDFRAAISTDSTGALIVEVMIPLNAFPKDPWQSDCFCLGFSVTSSGSGNGADAPPPTMQGDHQGGGGMPGGNPGGSGMQGGGMQGGGPGGRGMQGGGPGGSPEGMGSQDQSKTYKIWYKFALARQ
ncbi:MAG TPA: hypothetical protein PLD52_05690 [Bacteroidales bacterium]|nr:hypothetical protein [Bacteroidales bacterium]